MSPVIGVLLRSAIIGCGGSDGGNPMQSDAEAGTGGAGGAGGNGSDAGGFGGTGGGSDAGASDAAVWRDASIEDVDLTLGGLNQDLPTPSLDCFARESYLLGCMAISGEYNGEAFEMLCESNTVVVSTGRTQVYGCREIPLAGGNFGFNLKLARDLLSMPSVTFSVETAAPNAFAVAWLTERDFQNYNNGAFQMNALVDTHDTSFRAAGLSAVILGQDMSRDWRVDGTFALSLIPKSTCVPDSMGFGCDEVRLRGHFRMFPNEPTP